MHRAEVDDLHRAGAVDHDVLGPQILVQHFLAVKGLQALGDLLHDAAHGVDVGPGVVHHPLRQGLAVDVFHGHIQVQARPLVGAGLEHMGAVQAPCHPLFKHEAVKVGGLITQVYRRGLQHHVLAARVVNGQVDVAARAGLQFAHDGVAVKHHARAQLGWQGQALTVLEQPVGLFNGQRIDARHLHGEVVLAAARQRQRHQCASRCVQVGGVCSQRRMHGRSVQVFMHAVGGQHVNLTDFGGPVLVVDLHGGAHAQRPAQVAFGVGHTHAVVFGELLQRVCMQPVDACITHMQQVRLAALEDQRAEGAHVAAVLVKAAVTALGLGMQPRVGGLQNPLRGTAHGPGLRGQKVVFKKTTHGRCTGHLADRTAADAVRQGQRHAFGAQQSPRGHHRTVEVLVHGLAASLGVLTHGNAQRGVHRASWHSQPLRPGAWPPTCSAWSKAWRPQR